LYNISTGEAAPEHIKNFLFNVEEEENKKREDFFLNCIKDPNNFEQAISTLKCHTFTDMTNKKKNYCCPRRDGTTNAARPIRTTIQISLKKELDLDKCHCLCVPLTAPFAKDQNQH
jgi:hypothetical protein